MSVILIYNHCDIYIYIHRKAFYNVAANYSKAATFKCRIVPLLETLTQMSSKAIQT